MSLYLLNEDHLSVNKVYLLNHCISKRNHLTYINVIHKYYLPDKMKKMKKLQHYLLHMIYISSQCL